MKKIFLIFFSIIITILIIVYSVLFTNIGNKILSSYIEKVINHKQDELHFKIEEFNLTTKYLNLIAYTNDGSEIKVSGKFSIWKRDFNLNYSMNIFDLSIIKNLLHFEPKGSLCINGIFAGNYQNATIKGVSNIVKSQTKYNISLKDFELESLNIQIKEAKINELLMLMDKPAYLNGKLNVIADIKNINNLNLEGIIKSNIINGKVDNDIINEELELGITNLINFKSDFNALISHNNIKIKTIFDSSIGDLLIDKMIIDLSTRKVNSDYTINISNMNALSGFIDRKLVGNFTTKGELKKLKDTIKIEGVSDIFESETKYKAYFNNFNLSSILFSIEKAKIENLLKMISEPIYATGDLHINGDVKNADINKLDGFINSDFSNISIVNEVANTVFDQNIKDDITADLTINSILVPNQVVSKIDLETNIADLKTENSIYYIEEKFFSSDYLLNISSLEKIDNFIPIKLLGKIDISGNINIEDNMFLLNGKSNSPNEMFDFNLINDNLKLNLSDTNTKNLSTILRYPQIFDASNTNLNITYDLNTKKGELIGSLKNGHFLPNSFSSFLNPILKRDSTKEFYETVNINGKIKDQFLVSNITFKNKNTNFEINNLILDYEKNLINSKIDIKME
jgi:hypothetical protein